MFPGPTIEQANSSGSPQLMDDNEHALGCTPSYARIRPYRTILLKYMLRVLSPCLLHLGIACNEGLLTFLVDCLIVVVDAVVLIVVASGCSKQQALSVAATHN